MKHITKLHLFSHRKKLIGIATEAHQADTLRLAWPKAKETIIEGENAIMIGKVAGVLLSLLGGPSNGGKARSASLSPERRAEIARLAAMKRWNSKR